MDDESGTMAPGTLLLHAYTRFVSSSPDRDVLLCMYAAFIGGSLKNLAVCWCKTIEKIPPALLVPRSRSEVLLTNYGSAKALLSILNLTYRE